MMLRAGSGRNGGGQRLFRRGRHRRAGSGAHLSGSHGRETVQLVRLANYSTFI
jgi:hypothetical protein